MSIFDEDQQFDKPPDRPDKDRTKAAATATTHMTIDYSNFDAIEDREEAKIERRRWGPSQEKRTAPLRVTLNAKRFTLVEPWLGKRVCDLGRAYLKAPKAFRVFRLEGAARERVELGLLAEVGEALRDGDALVLEVGVTIDPADFPLEVFDGGSGGVLKGPSTTVDAYVDGSRVYARPAEVGPHTLELADGTRSTRTIRAPEQPPRPWAELPAAVRSATIEYLRASGAAFAVERADAAPLPLPPRPMQVAGTPPAPGSATVFRSWLTSEDHDAIATRALTLVDGADAAS